MPAEQLTVAICAYNGAPLLGRLLGEVASLRCPVPFEILVVDNNSTDHTREVIAGAREHLSVPLRYVNEPQQGIPFARNRAIDESLASTFLAFIDVDELPEADWLAAAWEGLSTHGAESVGGRITVDLPRRPPWLADTLLPFLGQVEYGEEPFPITDPSTPIWSGNIAYRTALFADGLRFDTRYNRAGQGVGGGSDAVMFRHMLAAGVAMRYEPRMGIRHLIPPEKLRRRYFLRLHYNGGRKAGMYQWAEPAGPTLLGVPRYMYRQLASHAVRGLGGFVRREPDYVRQLMNLSFHLGAMLGQRAHPPTAEQDDHV